MTRIVPCTTVNSAVLTKSQDSPFQGHVSSVTAILATDSVAKERIAQVILYCVLLGLQSDFVDSICQSVLKSFIKIHHKRLYIYVCVCDFTQIKQMFHERVLNKMSKQNWIEESSLNMERLF